MNEKILRVTHNLKEKDAELRTNDKFPCLHILSVGVSASLDF